ncbi:N-acetylated-alpha-linked acidic dipeptidase [Pseudomassariella vexata]|uniref:N-acetylated-alpha-linked acidic dipeptidase n=1 Tax=Pseudomassariella vexata TaxID=1141098 RepID=A0A1Y2E7U2_9PEZI|nr:N-acetylated-alpha-linked acidic dipeptidase [Pseudomassariella vexata]ORY67394.1 N-acetylated-alpha-linked acidic dipeptidase [Pseudomassariella vexata]
MAIFNKIRWIYSTYDTTTIMRTSKLLGVVALLATHANACQRERHFHHSNVKHQGVSPTPLTPHESTLVEAISNRTLSDWSYYYTHGAHLAGKNFSMAQWTADRWAENGIDSSVVTYNVYIDYPISKSLSLTYANGSVFHPSLEEAVLNEDSTSSYPDRIPTFHGYSANGNASAEYVYVGRGQQVDFRRLIELGVPLEGKIAISRYGGPFRGLKVKNAQEYGMVGAVLFTDPDDDGNMTEANGYAAYPDGPARNPTSVQRGSVQNLAIYPGDPTTPGYPSKNDPLRADPSRVLVKIPSIPISYVDAIPILEALDGHGISGREVNRTRWVGALNVSYSTGPAPGAVLGLSNLMKNTYAPIWNAIGVINGTNADETIVIGNHRDAWVVGGAADPNSGTAIIVELSKAFGALLAQGWKPKRNIVLCSWDGEEYGLVGSTEWVEEYIPWLTETAVSYLNIDVGVSGPHPGIAATPELHEVATETMKKILWMDSGRTMYDVWYEDNEGEIGVLGSGSDYTAFLDHAGIGAIDMGSNPSDIDPVYHYHSNYDSYHWMSKFGDPEFLTHQSMAQYLALLAYKLADDDLIPFNLSNYAVQMSLYYKDLISAINSTSETLDTSALEEAIGYFARCATELKQLEHQAVKGADNELLAAVNHKHRDFQRGFVSQGGIPQREFYRHVIFAPGSDTGYAAQTFPGISEALTAGYTSLAAEWVQKTANGIIVAADIIKP